MKILSAREIREADAYTISHEPIASIELMERASNAFVREFTRRFSNLYNVQVICGTGNNGGDGLAIARLLLAEKYKVKAGVIRSGESSADFNKNYERLNSVMPITEIHVPGEIPALSKDDILIDAIFGSGLTRVVSGIYSEVILAMNRSGATIVSVDIASGLPVDQPAQGDSIIRPSVTVSFQTAKPAFLIPENESFTGTWTVVDIGLDQEFIRNSGSKNYLISGDFLKQHLQPRRRFAHKGDFGKVLVLSGSLGKMGASVLCSKACLRAGAGLLTVHVPRCGYEIIQTSVPEAMASVDTETNFISGYPSLENFDAVGVGPGIGMHDHTVNMLGKLIDNFFSPAVFDADALNILARNSYLLENIPRKSILTPHIGEFERIAGTCSNHYERLDKQRELSKKHEIIIILKGAHSSVSLTDGSVFFNTTGNPGMATGGAGDVLTGIVTSLLGQKYTPEEAAIMSVYLHGLAGDLAVKFKGQEGLIASDIIEFLPEAISMSH